MIKYLIVSNENKIKMWKQTCFSKPNVLTQASVGLWKHDLLTACLHLVVEVLSRDLAVKAG